MNRPHPLPDTKFLESIFNESERKHLDAFNKHKALRAVQAYQKHGFNSGIIAFSDYYIYFNESHKAIDLLNESLNKNGYNDRLVVQLAKAYQFIGDFEQQINSILLYLNNIESKDNLCDEQKEDIQIFLSNIMNIYVMYLIDDSKILDAIIGTERAKSIMNEIDKQQGLLRELGISIDTYRKLVSITSQVVHKYYNKGFKFSLKVRPEFHYAQFAVRFNNITPSESLILNNEINDAVFEAGMDDKVFMKEVSFITTNCTLSYDSEEGLIA